MTKLYRKRGKRLRQAWFRSNPRTFFEPLFSDLKEYSDKYIAAIFSGPSNTIINGEICNSDFNNPYASVSQGYRHTTDAPPAHDHTVYMLGASWVYGYGAEDAQTIASYLQRQLNSALPGVYIVKNYGVRGEKYWNGYLHLANLGLKEGDLVFHFVHKADNKKLYQQLKIENDLCIKRNVRFAVILPGHVDQVINPTLHEKIFQHNSFLSLCTNQATTDNLCALSSSYSYHKLSIVCSMNGIPCFDLQHIFNRPHSMGEVFFDVNHWTYKANEKCAELLQRIILEGYTLPHVTKETVETLALKKLIRFVSKTYHTNDIDTYLQKTIQSRFLQYSRIGSIVMNANPFTNGHLYLIKEALKKVDALYIFVVQNDESFFSFSDRIRLVRKGVKDFSDTVSVVPSGDFIISSFTFPEYFTKEINPIEADSTLDILIFGSIIAKQLNITVRFVGEEPTCVVTQSYNATMQKYFPHMGIDLHIIPRMRIKNEIVSASKVRAMLDAKIIKKIKKHVPPPTYRFLVAKYGAERMHSGGSIKTL